MRGQGSNQRPVAPKTLLISLRHSGNSTPPINLYFNKPSRFLRHMLKCENA